MASNATNKIFRAWEYLKGAPDEFPLQHRIYHSICVATILVILYNIPFSLAIGLYKMTLLSVVLLGLQLFFYYLSRFKRKLHLSMIIYAIIINIFFAFDFYFSSGIQGATLHSFTITYFLIIAIAQKKHYWYWTLGNLTLVIGLVVYEYYHPEVVHLRYGNRSNQFIDITSTYVINIVLIFACLTYIINNYAVEKRVAEQNEMAIKRLSEEKSKLISIISHDFRTPLRNLQGYLYILRKTELDEASREHLEKELVRNMEEAQHLLNNLLGWTMKQMEGVSYELEALYLDECLREVLENAKQVAASKNVVFNGTFKPGLLVRANAELLQLMVSNLINNAIKFTDTNGHIHITTELTDGYCLLQVSDSGRGIDTADQQHIFALNIKPTYGTNHEKGAGLGLALCKELADMQNITLEFQSSLGNGSTFSLRIPLPHGAV